MMLNMTMMATLTDCEVEVRGIQSAGSFRIRSKPEEEVLVDELIEAVAVEHDCDSYFRENRSIVHLWEWCLSNTFDQIGSPRVLERVARLEGIESFRGIKSIKE